MSWWYDEYRAKVGEPNMVTHLVRETSDTVCLCGRKKSALTRHEQWLNLAALAPEDFDDAMCDKCTDVPEAQLLLLANTELG